jgi:spore coat assembly protein
MAAGANFASSPGRILIDFVDPIIVAEKIAVTDEYIFISGYEVAKEIKEGIRSISRNRSKR